MLRQRKHHVKRHEHDRLPQQLLPHLIHQRLDRDNAVVQHVIDGRATREPAAWREPSLLSIRRLMKGVLQCHHGGNDIEAVAATFHDCQGGRWRLDTLLRLPCCSLDLDRHGVLVEEHYL